MIQLVIPRDAVLAALRDTLAPLHERLEPGVYYTISGDLRTDGSLVVRATPVPTLSAAWSGVE